MSRRTRILGPICIACCGWLVGNGVAAAARGDLVAVLTGGILS